MEGWAGGARPPVGSRGPRPGFARSDSSPRCTITKPWDGLEETLLRGLEIFLAAWFCRLPAGSTAPEGLQCRPTLQTIPEGWSRTAEPSRTIDAPGRWGPFRGAGHREASLGSRCGPVPPPCPKCGRCPRTRHIPAVFLCSAEPNGAPRSLPCWARSLPPPPLG